MTQFTRYWKGESDAVVRWVPGSWGVQSGEKGGKGGGKSLSLPQISISRKQHFVAGFPL